VAASLRTHEDRALSTASHSIGRGGACMRGTGCRDGGFSGRDEAGESGVRSVSDVESSGRL
jgi:hypothetical protein